MSQRLAIDCYQLHEREHRTPNGFRTVQTWLRANSIDPHHVPVHSEMVLEDSAFGWVIRYQVYRRTPGGRLFPDPNAPDRLATEDRTALLVLPPPRAWVTTGGGRR